MITQSGGHGEWISTILEARKLGVDESGEAFSKALNKLRAKERQERKQLDLVLPMREDP